MEIVLAGTESTPSPLIDFLATLPAEEASDLARGAYQRLATLFHTSEESAKARAKAMLTDKELATFVEETLKSRAADRAILSLNLRFMLSPSIRAKSPYVEGTPFTISMTAHPVPLMSIDASTPLEIAKDEQGQDTKETILRALSKRLMGTIPATLENLAFSQQFDGFQLQLEKHGETFREYRIRTGKKIQDVEEDLRRSAMEKLYEEIALETIYRAQGLSVTPEDERTALSSMAPGREDDLRAELDNAGRLWMLSQKARRDAALRWAVEHLLR